MDKKEYTTGSTCYINDNLRYDISDKFNFNPKDSVYFPNGQWSFQWCQYYLPCGLCEKTMQPCPKRGNQGGDGFLIINYCKTGGSLNE